MNPPDPFDFIASAKRTIGLEQSALEGLTQGLNQDFTTACQLILDCTGRIVVTGMGKSGHIGNKIAATLASTGTPAFFVHPGEASHGDMGMITRDDVVISLSNSGETNEVTSLLPLLVRLNVPMIAITGNDDSTLAAAAQAHLNAGVETEACPLNLAPTSSTTCALVIGDALAIALLEARGFTAEDFAFSHPGGSLGRRLLLKVTDIMHSGSDIPAVNENASLSGALLEMTSKGKGLTTVTNQQGELSGIFTDGDLRRAIDQGVDLHSARIGDLMTADCVTVGPGVLAAQAVKTMEEQAISAIVVQTEGKTLGLVTMHDVLKAGVI